MMLSSNFHRAALALILVVSACGDDAPVVDTIECGAGTMLVGDECVANAPVTCAAGTMLMGTMCVPVACPAGSTAMNGVCVPNSVTTYRQVEQLGRPGIAEALLITPAFLEGYNATAPSFAGAPAAAVAAITAEAKTVLKAIFHGTCLLNGLLGFNATNGAVPAGVPCGQVGGAVFTGGNPLTGTVIDPAQATAATTYADKVFGQFITDVLRIDTAVTSAYLTPCNATLAAGMPLLCGGRKLNDDVIDITYFYLIAGAAVPSGTTALNAPQVIALVTDGAFFSANNAENSGIGLGTPDPNNRNQFHQSCANCGTPVISATFPYSAPPR